MKIVMMKSAIGFLSLFWFCTGCATVAPNLTGDGNNPALAPTIRIGNHTELPVRGKVTVMQFLAEHCNSCRRMTADLDRLARNDSFEDIRFVGIVAGRDGRTTEALRRREKASYDWFPDPEGAIARHYAVEGVPTVLVVDATGRIIYESDGASGDGKKIASLLRVQAEITREQS